MRCFGVGDERGDRGRNWIVREGEIDVGQAAGARRFHTRIARPNSDMSQQTNHQKATVNSAMPSEASLGS